MLIILDDFFPAPESIRNSALQSEYSNRNGLLPGFRSTTNVLSKELVKQIFPLVKKIDRQIKNPSAEGFFQYFTKNSRKSYVHIDYGNSWSGIVYLNPTPLHYPGTSFYRHKETALDCISDESIKSLEKVHPKLASESAIAKRVNRDRYEYDRWKLVMTVPAKFNRLLLFRANYFHMNSSKWGTRVENSRLTYNFFIA